MVAWWLLRIASFNGYFLRLIVGCGFGCLGFLIGGLFIVLNSVVVVILL